MARTRKPFALNKFNTPFSPPKCAAPTAKSVVFLEAMPGN